jgi:hypothetical protein
MFNWSKRIAWHRRSMSIWPTASDIDGIMLDAWGNPQTYTVLRQHPGDLVAWKTQYDLVPAEAVVHWFRSDRPGQHRGVPEITPALPLFAQLRRYTLAVIAAAETAADFAAVLFTDAPANGEAQALEPMDVVELEKRMATVLPDGWRLGQIEAQQPTTSYAEFKREILNEIARCLNLPYNIAACNSSGYNYASGRLDHQTYYKAIRVEQAHLAEAVLDRIFAAWVTRPCSPPSCRCCGACAASPISGSSTAPSTSIRPKRPTRRPRVWPATPPPSPPSTPARERTGRSSCASGPKRSADGRTGAHRRPAPAGHDEEDDEEVDTDVEDRQAA